MLKVMFLCTGNSCRSQMAEGLARVLGEGTIEPYSAGLIPAGVNPHAIKVMKEIGIDISSQRSKTVDRDLLMTMDLIISLCGDANTHCPSTPPGITRLHWPMEDPVWARGTEEEILREFRRARDEIRLRIGNFLLNIK
jgi:arsenate reductase